MAKRFTDTEKWRKQFIKGLDTVYKLLWFYILDECDHAGIWHVEMDIASLRIGESLSTETAKKVFGDHIMEFDEGEKWFIRDFVDFQYGILNENVKTHKSVIDKLRKYKIYPFKQFANSLQTVKDKDKDKDKEKDKDNIPFDDFWQKYPNKKGKSEAELLWNGTKNLNNGNKITNEERRHILKILSEFAAEQKDLKFTPHAMTFLRQRKFEDYTAKTTEDLQRDEYKRRGLIWRPGTKQHGLKV